MWQEEKAKSNAQLCLVQEVDKLPKRDDRASDCLSELHKYSSYEKCIRIVACLVRWRHNAQSKIRNLPNFTGAFRAEERSAAKIMIFKGIQRYHFESEYAALCAKRQIPYKSVLFKFNAFLDEDGLIRVGGRLHNAPIPYSEKHPIILPSKCYFIKRLVEYVHCSTLHGDTQLMCSYIRRFA